jgi:hypothetical protein
MDRRGVGSLFQEGAYSLIEKTSVHRNNKMQLETYHGPDPTGRHGTNGPIHISGGTFRASRGEDAFVTAAAQVGWPDIEDLQILDANNGVQRAMRFVSPDGKRQSTAAQ